MTLERMLTLITLVVGADLLLSYFRIGSFTLHLVIFVVCLIALAIVTSTSWRK